MKTLIISISILFISLSLQSTYHNRYRHHKLKKVSHKAKYKMLTHLLQNEITDALHSLSDRRLKRVSQDGKYQISDNVAQDIKQQCTTNLFPYTYLGIISDAVSKFVPISISQTHNVYYVGSGFTSPTDCQGGQLANKGTLFMVLSQEYPEDINFFNSNEKIVFFKVCYKNGNPYVLKNCPFDKCSQTSEQQDKDKGTIDRGDDNKDSYIPGDCMFNLDP